MADPRKKSPLLMPLVCFVMLIVAAFCAFLVPVCENYSKKRAELGSLSVQLNDCREELADLSGEVAALRSSPEAVEKVAREKFGLVGDNESVIRYPLPEKAK